MRLTILLLFLSIVSCSSHDIYPDKWPKIIDPTKTDCPDISGSYKNAGSENINFCNKVSSILDISGYAELTDKITILKTDCASVIISSWYRDSILGSRKFSKEDGNLTCDKCSFNVKLPNEYYAEQVSAVAWGNLTFINATDDSLIIKYKSPGVGILCLFPIAVTGSEWYRLEKMAD